MHVPELPPAVAAGAYTRFLSVEKAVLKAILWLAAVVVGFEQSYLELMAHCHWRVAGVVHASGGSRCRRCHRQGGPVYVYTEQQIVAHFCAAKHIKTQLAQQWA